MRTRVVRRQRPSCTNKRSLSPAAALGRAWHAQQRSISDPCAILNAWPAWHVDTHKIALAHTQLGQDSHAGPLPELGRACAPAHALAHAEGWQPAAGACRCDRGVAWVAAWPPRPENRLDVVAMCPDCSKRVDSFRRIFISQLRA